MRPRGFIGVMLLPALAIAGAATAAAGETVSFKVGGETVQAWIERPASPAGAPGVVVLHEWWGLNDQIKGVAGRLAGLGYLAIVPDLYRGKVATEASLAHELMRGLTEDRAVAVVKGAIAYLRGLDGAAGRPVGAVGFCMGGGYSLASAIRGADLQAAVMFYGAVQTTKEAVAPIRAPLLGIFGAEDRGIFPEDVRKFEAALKEAGKTATIVIVPGVGHAFCNETGPNYNKEKAGEAWARMKEFLAGTLATRSEPPKK